MRAAAVALAAMLAGCIQFEGGRDDVASVAWTNSTQSCTNGVCSYGQNQARLEDDLRCSGSPVLEWTGTKIIHGAATVWVEDGEGTVVYEQGGRNGAVSQALHGAGGTWTLHLDTRNLNGQLRATLTCP